MTRRIVLAVLIILAATISALIVFDAQPAAAPTPSTWYSGDGDLVEITP